MKIVMLIFIAFSINVIVNGQSKTTDSYIYSCEENAARLDVLINTLNTNKELSFVIARLGDKEHPRISNQLRLKRVRAYLIEKRRFDSKRFIFAEGDKANGLGRIEFYV